MDELRGPNIQIVLHVKEGLGFGFLKSPFVVSGSLNGYMLETDPVVPIHAPIFDAELVWEADKRRFRSLRVQNVPVKIEVYTTATQGRKDKVGYLLLSLLAAQPCPANKVVDLKHSWHKLLGVKSEGKCCHPQLLLSLSIEDRVSTPTPRNELRMFHSNEVAYPHQSGNPPTSRSLLLTLNEYIAESKRTVSSPDLQPKLICEEGLIQIGTGNDLFLLELVIGSVENIDLLLPSSMMNKDGIDCYISYSVFTHTIATDRVAVTAPARGGGCSAHVNQRSALRVRADLPTLARYFARCPHLVLTVRHTEHDLGICSVDLTKLVPTTSSDDFLSRFCNRERALCVQTRCFLLPCGGEAAAGARVVAGARRPHVDVDTSLTLVGAQPPAPQRPVCGAETARLTARSAAQLASARAEAAEGGARVEGGALEWRAGSCTQLAGDAPATAYTAAAPSNTARYKTASGDTVLQTNEIAEMIKQMCDTFTASQQRLLTSRQHTSDAQTQWQEDGVERREEMGDGEGVVTAREEAKATREEVDREPVRLETSKSDTCVNLSMKATPLSMDPIRSAMSSVERGELMQRFVDELEDWKEKQQELFKCQLKRKEVYHLELLAKEWAKRRVELESKLSGGVERCRQLAADLSRATEDFRLRGYRNTERERKLLEAKKALESHYTAKYQELREASQKMQDDMNHQLKLKDMRVEELETRAEQMEKQIEALRTDLKNCERDAESRYSGLTKDQTASLIQELRCLEEKLEGALQSKSFFKQQWGRAVRELHAARLAARAHALLRLRTRRAQLGRAEPGLDTIDDQEEGSAQDAEDADIAKLKDDFYVDLLADTPALETRSVIDTSGVDAMELYDELNVSKKQGGDKLNELIAQREALVRRERPDEAALRRLSAEIRALLLNGAA